MSAHRIIIDLIFARAAHYVSGEHLFVELALGVPPRPTYFSVDRFDGISVDWCILFSGWFRLGSVRFSAGYPPVGKGVNHTPRYDLVPDSLR